ncbi:hypothetical protein RvY_09183 [Ramazzottius varieornatus]|uniref:mitogen-activated protein kinase kinase n=1 Tax=Ramazzottius varieornatus TaxID=947166 RepID=A0A1D1VAQ5_RAMVA|nr:hypothetical protein RvY_09183 [Ramazzottius varieornatus]
MSLGPGRKPRPVIAKISQQARTPSADHAVPHPDLDSRAAMMFDTRDTPYQVSAADLEQLGSLGRGQYGQVDRVRHKESGFEFAVKRIRSTDDPEERKRMLMDLNVNQMSCGKCPYVVRSYGALFCEGDLWICMEVMDISLEQFYKKLFAQGRTFPDEVLGFITFAIVSGLQFLKEQLNIMHRDVKPSNVLLSRKGEVKLCDFGISGQLVQSLAKTRNVGCSLYMSPERVSRRFCRAREQLLVLLF